MVRKIHFYGDPVLRLKAQEVKVFNQELKDLVRDMFETMVEAEGVGLAAPQIGISQRVLVIDLRQGSKGRLAVVNPRLQLCGESESASEGCLSIPGISAEVSRPSHVRLVGSDPDGQALELEADGLMARALQHEVDHLDGVFFVDRLSSVRRALIAGKLRKLEKDFILGRTPEHPKEELERTAAVEL